MDGVTGANDPVWVMKDCDNPVLDERIDVGNDVSDVGPDKDGSELECFRISCLLASCPFKD